MTESRIKRLKLVLKDYEKNCTVSENLIYFVVWVNIFPSLSHRSMRKNFDFLKQHACSHVIDDIMDKGTTDNFSTRPGEGFQQEAAQAYAQTNGKNAEHQVSNYQV